MKRKFVAILIIFVIGAFLVNSGIQADSNNAATGKTPQFTLKDLDGKDVSLKDYKDKVVLINIWATWCGPCRQEIPDLIKIRDKYKDQGFEILGIVVSSKEPDVKKMVGDYKINYPVLWGTEKALAELGQIPAIPRTFILNRQGQIVEDITGSRDYAFFDKVIGGFFSGSD